MKKRPFYHSTFLVMAIMVGSYFLVSADIKVKDGKPIKEKKEWKIERGRRELDHVTKYNKKGKKIEELEYASYGLKERIVYEYGANGKISKKSYYGGNEKLEKTIIPEYNLDGDKIKETTYKPNGKKLSIKEYEFIY